jgi:hypothetical protein
MIYAQLCRIVSVGKESIIGGKEKLNFEVK